MVDKSFSAFGRFIREGVLGNLVGTSPSAGTTIKSVGPEGISRGFELFVQSVHRAKNKYDEEQVVNRELQSLRADMSEKVISKIPVRDFLCRLVYADLLGYDVSFGHIHAVQQCHRDSYMDRKTAYLACCILMHRGDELSYLLTNTIQKDLVSANFLDNLLALSACSQILPVEMIPYILPAVLDNLRHSRELVRQKAVLCLYQFQLLAPDLLEHNQSDLEKMMFDKDPGVMAAAVYVIQNSIQRDPARCKGFGEILVSILKQISSHKMATMFECHTIPFPWLQIQILKCLTKLSAVEDSLARSLGPLLKEILQKTSVKEPVAVSILYECIQCILCVSSPKHLLDEAAVHIGRFLKSSQPNFKFIGVKLLVCLVRVNPEYSTDYQQLIVQSLENQDFYIQRQMYTLLYEIANERNISVVCAKLLTQLQTSTDKFWKLEVVTMVISLLERFGADSAWQVESLFSCLQLGNDVIRGHSLNDVMKMLDKKLLSPGVDERYQKVLVQKCVAILVNNSSLPTSLHISAWVIGELCPLLKNMPDDKVISLLTRHLSNEKLAYSVQSSIVTALHSLVMKGVVNCDTMATEINECLKRELPIVIKQHLSVILNVCRHGLTLEHHDSIDTTLTFLDDLVTDDLEMYGIPYVPQHLRDFSSGTEAADPSLFNKTTRGEGTLSGQPRTESTTSSTKTTEESESGMKLPNVIKVWRKEGRIDMSRKENIEESPCTKTNDQTEEEKRQQDLASALFAGFHVTEKTDSKDDDTSGFLPNSSDKAGWKNLHSLKTTEKSSAMQYMCSNDHSEEELEMSKKSSATDGFLRVDSHSICQADLLGTDISILDKNERHTEQYTDFDLDKTISALLDDCQIDNEQMQAGIAKNSCVLDSVTSSEQFLHVNESVGTHDGTQEIRSKTNTAGHIYKECESSNSELGEVNSIYVEDTMEENSQLLSDGVQNESIYTLDS